MIKALESVILIVREKQRSLAFYTEAMGLPILREGATSVVLQVGSVELVLQEFASTSPPVDDFWTLIKRYPRGLGVVLRLRVEDVDEFHTALKEKGFHTAEPGMDRYPDQRAFEVADPDGYRLLITGLVSAES